MEKKLKEIIEIPEIELVVNIDDVDSKGEELYSSFIVTEEIKKSLDIILEKIKKLKGCGIFVKGNFGSGKSHFLSYLYILLNNFHKIKTVKILLTKYPSNRTLEEIILENFNFKEKILNRDEVFKKIITSPTAIIIDELTFDFAQVRIKEIDDEEK